MKIFVSVAEENRISGLSQAFLRKGVADGSIPHIMSGVKVLINHPALMLKLGVPDDFPEGSKEKSLAPGGSR